MHVAAWAALSGSEVMTILEATSWLPYIVGCGIGVLAVLCLILSDTTLGTSTTYVRCGGMIERLFRGTCVLDKTYYQQTPPRVDWQFMLVVGIVVGALISALLSHQFKWQAVPALWTSNFGPAVLPRMVVAFMGGVLLGLGGRWAGGCTSGHGISGTMQLAISSWIATICFFIGGVIVAMLMYKVW